MNEKILRLWELIEESRNTVAITGAGISVSSGIIAFAGMNFPVVIQMTSTTVLKSMPEHYYKMARKAFLGPMFENGPSLTHKKLAKLEKQGRLQGIITTNIDCLHTMAGSQNVAEIQGSFRINKCLRCGRHCDDLQIWNQGKAPRCKECDGLMAAFPVYQHIGLLENEVQKARSLCKKAELILIIGAQGSYGGTYYSHIRAGTKIVQINPETTQFDEVALFNIRERADEVFALLPLY